MPTATNTTINAIATGIMEHLQAALHQYEFEKILDMKTDDCRAFISVRSPIKGVYGSSIFFYTNRITSRYYSYSDDPNDINFNYDNPNLLEEITNSITQNIKC